MYFTQGVILKKVLTGEADVLLTVYTKDFGKMQCRVQGVRKEAAKLRGHIEPVSHVSLGLITGKAGERLTYAVSVHSFRGIRDSEEKMRVAAYIIHSIDRACFEGEKDERLWNEALAQFHALETARFREGETSSSFFSFPPLSPDARVFLGEWERQMQELLGNGDRESDENKIFASVVG